MSLSGSPNTNPDQDFTVVKRRIEELINSGQPAAAKGLCADLCRQCGGDPHALFLMAAIHAQLGEYAEAEHRCREIIGIAPGIPSVYFNRGIALMNLKRFTEAIESFQDALRFQPDFIEAHVNLGDALMADRKFERACRAYRDAVRLRPRIPAVHARLGAALRESGDLAGAEQSLQRALGLDPNQVPTLLELGRLRMQRGQHAEAITAFREVLRVDPNCREAREQIGNIELSLGNFESAVESYLKILEFAPADTAVRVLVARMLASRGLLERAENVCRHGLVSSPDDVALLCELGKIVSEQGKAQEAVHCLQRARELAPRNEEVDYLLSSFGQNRDAHLAKQKYIRKVFDGYADSFDSHLQDKLHYRTPELIWQAVHETGAMFPDNLDIIDLGCGTGLCGPLFRKAAGKLVGVDLSANMLEKARERKIYDELHEADIIDVLQRAPRAYDMALAADVFVYVGDLVPVFAGCAMALRPDGLLAFSVEAVTDGTYVLRNSGRYGHSLRYVRESAENHGFDVLTVRETMIRKEGQHPISGYIFVLKKKPD